MHLDSFRFAVLDGILIEIMTWYVDLPQYVNP